MKRSLHLNKLKLTNQSNLIKSNHSIFNPENSIVNTLNGDDEIIGNNSISSDFGLGMLIGVTAKNLGFIIASAKFRNRAIATDGIKNRGIISTGNGSDSIIGTATASISIMAATISQAIAIANKANTTVFTQTFANIKFNATIDGIDNCGSKINTGNGNDSISGHANGSLTAVAIAIVEAVAQAPTSQGLTAFAAAMATSLVNSHILTTGINNREGIINMGNGLDIINASANSTSAISSEATSSSLTSANSENVALSQAVANAAAIATDQAIAIYNTSGDINMGSGNDTIIAQASGSKSYGIFGGNINMGNGNDTIIAQASGSESYGIFGGNMNMGNGDDSIEVSSFGGGVNINMGQGNDFVQGYGDATIDGGCGFDTFSLGAYRKSDFKISMNGDYTVFELGNTIMKTTGFEDYIFAGVHYSLVDLS